MTKCPTEIVISGIEVKNPPGGYTRHTSLLSLDQLDLHVNITSVIKAIIAKKRNPFSFPVIEIPMIHVRGLTISLEKAPGSLFATPPNGEILNLWALLGGSPLKKVDAEQLKQAEEASKKEAEEDKKIDEEEDKGKGKGKKNKKEEEKKEEDQTVPVAVE